MAGRCHQQVKGLRGGWLVGKIPSKADKNDIVEAIHSKVFGANAEKIKNTFHVDLRKGGAFSFAFVTPLSEGAFAGEGTLLASGLEIHGHLCSVKRRRRPKRERIQEALDRKGAKRAAAERAEAKRSPWKPTMLARFPVRERSLDQHAQVSELDSELKNIIEAIYLASVFPPSCRKEIVAAFKHIWENHSKSLRVKELFETIESFRLIEKQISGINAVAKKRNEKGIETIFDLACGHGLLGVLLAYRFPASRVICVDLMKRPCFEHYVCAFQKHGTPDAGEAVAVSNVSFRECDFSALASEVSASSFLVMIHGCNEASKDAVNIAQEAGAAFACMPCCIRDGLYCVKSTSHADDATRYAIMCGVLAGSVGAHRISSIDPAITNRNVMIFGGFEPIQ